MRGINVERDARMTHRSHVATTIRFRVRATGGFNRSHDPRWRVYDRHTCPACKDRRAPRVVFDKLQVLRNCGYSSRETAACASIPRSVLRRDDLTAFVSVISLPFLNGRFHTGFFLAVPVTELIGHVVHARDYASGCCGHAGRVFNIHRGFIYVLEYCVNLTS